MGGKADSPVVARLKKEEHRLALESLAKQKKRAQRNMKNCILLDMAPTKEGGYVQLFIHKDSPKVLAHVLAWFDDWEELQEFIKDPTFFKGKDVSHLCGNRLCVNRNHLVFEDSTKNQRRKGCKGFVTCPCPCGHTFNVCECDPVNKCI